MPKAVELFEKGLEICAFSGADSVLIALSGGADSVALLRLFCAKREKSPLRIGACHVHHGIRGEEAERDLTFCKALCARLSVDFHPVYVNVPQYQREQKVGLEEGARHLRYQALERVAEEQGYALIATAHNADDHLETVLFHLARGSGSLGMQGIAPRRGKVIRPLLHLTKDEILDYLDGLCQDFVQDSTNEDDRYTRNYIRHHILPAMRHINSEAARASVGMSASLREDEAFLQDLCSQSDLRPDLPRPILYRLLAEKYAKAGGKGATKEHYAALLFLYCHGQEGKRLSLPGGICAVKEQGDVRFERSLRHKVRSAPAKDCFPVFWKTDSQYSQNDRICVVKCDCSQKVYNLSTNVAVSSAILGGGLYWRYRRAGDTIRIGGMTRQVRELFRSLGLSDAERKCYPVVCDEKGPLWVPGFPPRDDAVGEDAVLVLQK